MNVRRTRRYIFHHLGFFPSVLTTTCGGLFHSSSFFLVFAASAMCPSVLQYLGKWHFRAVVSRTEAHIQKFQAMDSMWFDMEEAANDTLLTTGYMRV